MTVRTRFAPSPTGYMHVGNLRTALYAYLKAKSEGGTFILRIEDTDQVRQVEGAVDIIYNTLRQTGLLWDEGPDIGGPVGPYVQSERMGMFKQYAEQLVKAGQAYYCFCTPEKLEADRKAAQERHDPFQGYQRTCRDIDPAEAQRRVDAGEPYTIRIKVPQDRSDVVVHDAVHGDVTFNARELDDFIIFRSDGTPTYNFATVVDDADMGITHIIRGDDHLSNTPRQVMVYEALGAPVPVFAHISMILGADGKKLSKRHGATSVEEYRDAGYLSDAFVNYLALLGWALDGETTIVPRDVLASRFSLDHVSKNPATFDPEKLDWVNGQYLQAMDDSTFSSEVLMPQLVAAGLETEGAPAHDSAWYDLLSSLLKPRTTLAPQVVEKARFLYEGDEVTLDEKSVSKNIAKEGVSACLEAAREALEAIDADGWHAEAIDAALEELPERLGVGKRKVFQAVRVAECGNQVSPPLGASMELLGRDASLARLTRAMPLAG